MTERAGSPGGSADRAYAGQPCRIGSAILLAVAVAACSRPPQSSVGYLVTDSPVDVGVVTSRLCIAADTQDPQGIWWWEAGEGGCVTRSTGPGVFCAERASVSPGLRSGTVNLSFRLSTHSRARPFANVRLVIEGDYLRAPESGDRVPLHRLNELDVPEAPVRR